MTQGSRIYCATGVLICLLCIQIGNCHIVPSAKLIFATKASVRMLVLEAPAAKVRTLANTSQACGVSFDSEGDDIFWTDITEEKIYRSKGSKVDGTDVTTIVDTGLNTPQSVAYDWIAHNVYYIDSYSSNTSFPHVGVCDRDGNSCTVLLQDQMDKPRGIALHPATGKLFWSDWGRAPAIFSAGMDGSSPLPIIRSGLKWPNGLTIDHGSSRIYWIDAGVKAIETTDLNGQDRLAVKTTGIKHPFSLDVFGDTLYWSDWTTNQIESCNKVTGGNHEVVVHDVGSPINGITIFHHSAQPKNRQNDCKGHKCSHICVLAPVTSLQKFRCVCPTGMTLLAGTRTCNEISPEGYSQGNEEESSTTDFLETSSVSESASLSTLTTDYLENSSANVLPEMTPKYKSDGGTHEVPLQQNKIESSAKLLDFMESINASLIDLKTRVENLEAHSKEVAITKSGSDPGEATGMEDMDSQSPIILVSLQRTSLPEILRLINSSFTRKNRP